MEHVFKACPSPDKSVFSLNFENILCKISFDDSDDIRSMDQLQKEVRAIQDVSTGATTDVVRYYGLTFHEVNSFEKLNEILSFKGRLSDLHGTDGSFA